MGEPGLVVGQGRVVAGDPRQGRACRGDRSLRGVGLVVHRKDREHGIADEFQHLAARFERRAGCALEELVQEVEVAPVCEPLLQSRRAAHVRHPHHRRNAVLVAAPNASLQHPRAGIRAEVGLEQRPSRRA
ncbi:MAG: hypothetical protein ABI080_02900 [Candidatus Binatia bacterium]